MVLSVPTTIAIFGTDPSVMALMPCILSDDSSESEGNVDEADSISASSREEVASGKAGHSVKAQHLEELEANSKERHPSVQP